jgi:hypothetical protein
MVMISSYPCGLYEAWLRGWRRFEFQAMTRGGVRTEVIWMNFPSCGSHWATFAGVNFTDRQRIKRKAQRWADNYRRLPAGEQTAILAAILKAHSDPTHPVLEGGKDSGLCRIRHKRDWTKPLRGMQRDALSIAAAKSAAI